jgi:hypothetical protein
VVARGEGVAAVMVEEGGSSTGKGRRSRKRESDEVGCEEIRAPREQIRPSPGRWGGGLGRWWQEIVRGEGFAI